MNTYSNPEEMVQAFNRGEVEGFNKIYRSLSHGLFQHILRMVENFEEAEDITSDVFLKLWQKRGHFENIRKINVFLYKVASNACIDYLRKRKTISMHQKEAMEELLRLQQQGDEQPEQSLTSVWPMPHIYASIERLPAKRRQVFKMYFIERLSNSEIAKRLNLSEKTVRNLKLLAKKRLQFFLRGRHTILTGAAFLSYFLLLKKWG